MKTANERCKGIGTPGCEKMREDIFRKHLFLSNVLATRYLKTTHKQGYVKANIELRHRVRKLKLGETGLYADMDDEAFKDYAESKSRTLEKDIFAIGKTGGPALALTYARDCVNATEIITFPMKERHGEKPNKKHVIPALARTVNANWWLRKIRKVAKRKVEQVTRELSLVSRKSGVYISEYNFVLHKARKKRSTILLQDLIAENEDGYSQSLYDIQQKGQANPENKRIELMVRMRGYEEIAKELGLCGVFITLTAPSKFHAIRENGSLNNKFDGSTPHDCQLYFNKIWAKVRAKWKRNDITPFGFRIAEPHHDGTPHWHMLLFVSPEQKDQTIEIFNHYACEVNNDEIKHDSRIRFDHIDIDWSKGSAAGYIAKYVSKNINGHKVEIDDEAGEYTDKTFERVEAWASTWGIRQFQQIGSSSVTVWRELRRGLREDIFKNDSDELLQQIAQAADEGNWALFVTLMGGATSKRCEQVIKPLLVLSDLENKYGEIVKKIQGLLMRGTKEYITHIHTWTIKKESVSDYKPTGPPELDFEEGENRPPLDLCQ